MCKLKNLKQKIKLNKFKCFYALQINNKQLESIIGQNQNVYENIIVNKSKRVHLGNVTVINGPIYIKESQKTKKNDDIVSDIKPEHLKLAEGTVD